ncbi:MAG: hypothetical protein Fur002_24710 [Anaerolineales bacterium]
MRKQQKYRKKTTASAWLPAWLGAGLVLVGIALFAALKSAANAPAAQLNSVVPMQVSYPAPPLSLSAMNGETEALQDLLGSVVLVNNWATWCPPCKAEMPSLQKYYEAHKEQGFTIVAVEAGEGKEEVAQFVDSFGLTFRVWLDPDGAALKAFKNGSLPNSYVIDPMGMVRFAWTGEISYDMLEKFITPLLNSPRAQK